MISNKVVLSFKDGTVLKGLTSDFFPNKNDFHITSENDEIITVIMEDLKAVFFVKDYAGDKSRKDVYEDDIPGGGRKIYIKFKDNEEITAFCQGYSSSRPGFFVVPADKKGNNERIYIISSATAEVKFL